MKKLIYYIFIILFINNCVLEQHSVFNQKTNFSNLAYELTYPIYSKITPNSTIYITDFVNEKDFQNHSQLGFLLSNEVKVKITTYNTIKVKELQLAKTLKIGKNGTKMLSRDLKELKIKNLADINKILIGSYMITKKQLILFLRLIDLKTSDTIIANSIATPLTNEILELEGISTKKNETQNIEVYTPLHL